MEIDRLFGLPAHPLIVHAPVVLIPLIAALALVPIFRPAWLTRFGLPLAVSCVVLSVLCIMAAGSGEKLESHLAELGRPTRPARVVSGMAAAHPPAPNLVAGLAEAIAMGGGSPSPGTHSSSA